jgi:hypothetical protein
MEYIRQRGRLTAPTPTLETNKQLNKWGLKIGLTKNIKKSLSLCNAYQYGYDS